MFKSKFLIGAVLAACCLVPQAVSAQDGGQNQPGQFDFYVLSLSWSPSFCAAAAERNFGRWPDRIVVLQPGDVGLASLPLYHAFGQTNIQNALLFSGGAVSYQLRFCPKDAAARIARVDQAERADDR